jgi:hypothetical protein
MLAKTSGDKKSKVVRGCCQRKRKIRKKILELTVLDMVKVER